MTSLLWLLAPALAARGEDSLGECWDLGTLYDDVTDAAGVRAYGAARGANLNDFDGDGDIDVLVAMGPSRVDDALYYPGDDLLYVNQGDGTFVEDAGSAGLADTCDDRAPLFGDLDEDGLPDLYVTVDGENVLRRNLGGGRWADVTAAAGAAGHVGQGHQGFLFDYDRDGFLDVFFTNGPDEAVGENVLLRNQGDRTFRDVSAEAGVGDPDGAGTCVLDADNDGWDDIFVTTGRDEGNHLYMNLGDGTFADEAVARGVSDPLLRYGDGVVCGDLDNDGDDDVLVLTRDGSWSGNQLFENLGDGTFVDVAAATDPIGDDNIESAALADFVDAGGAALVDVDLDGWLDIILSGSGSPLVFRNLGGLTFERACGDGAAADVGLTVTDASTWAVVGGDLTGDGFPEVLVTHGLERRPGEAKLYRHRGGAARWLTIEVRSPTVNPSQIGARVTVSTAATTQVRRVGTWSSRDSQGPLPLTFGLGEASTADVRVELALGDRTETVEWLDVAADQVLVVEADADRADADRDGVPDAWDDCGGTRTGFRTDGRGCAVGQRHGVAVGLTVPLEDAILAEPVAFAWQGDTALAVVQISTDGTFGPAGRIDWGPIRGGTTYTPTAGEWEELVASTDGTRPLSWRVVAVADDGGEAVTDPRRFHVAVPTNRTDMPAGVNVFEPAHAVVGVNEAFTWYNEAAVGGNLDGEAHDLLVIDANGVPVTPPVTLESAGFFTWTFANPGTYYMVCRRHSGGGTAEDQAAETTLHAHDPGPYRCMAGSVTVR